MKKETNLVTGAIGQKEGTVAMRRHHHEPTGHDSKTRLALSATVHCLVGCGLGEVAGMIIGVALALSNTATIVLALVLGFVFGFALGLIPLIRAGLGWTHSIKQVMVGESLSIVVMETAEILVQVYTPGVMSAGLMSGLFWGGMLLALIAGFLAAYPVNYWLVGKGIRHQH